jgi:DNA processing protein
MDSLLILTLASGLGPVLTRRAMAALGSAETVVGASVQQLSRVEGLAGKRAGEVRRGIDEVIEKNLLAREKELIANWGVSLLALGDSGYPPLLTHISDPPPLLYVRGSIRREDSLALAIVGARSCTAYGREQADRLGGVCVQAGLTIVSGGAAGIDGSAHHAAVRAGGRTIAVLGSGLAEPYPSENAKLFDRIAGVDSEEHGAVISELPMCAPPMAQNFPRRNRIVSGMSLGVLVIEASLRSGALITARIAAEEHGREVMALPGRVDSSSSAGCHKIIREGWATLVTSGADVLDALGETGSLLKAGMTIDADGHDKADVQPTLFEQNLSASQRKIVDSLAQPRQLEQIASNTGLAIHVIQADLTMLQIRGVVAKDGMSFRRKRS